MNGERIAALSERPRTVAGMTTIADSRRVARVLEDPRYLVPEADAAATAPFDAFRRAVSRFANGPVHVERRADVDALLARLNHANRGGV